MNNRLIYETPIAELIYVRFEGNIMSQGVDTQNTSVYNPFNPNLQEEEW